MGTLPVCSDALPRINITAPADQSIFYVENEDEKGWYVEVTLRATASDEEDPPGSLTVSWNSDVQGELSQGAEIRVKLYLYSSPNTVHVITARTQDSAGHTERDSIRVNVSTIL